MTYLYITEHGADLSEEGGYFVIKHKDGMRQMVPKERLESLAIFANVNVTNPCFKELLKRSIPVSFFSQYGAYFGRLESTRNTNVFRLKKQVYLSDNMEFRLEFTKKILKAKINNQIVLLRRYIRNSAQKADKSIREMSDLAGHLERCSSVEQCMGYEGRASHIYFSVLSGLVPEPFKFKGRSKMPPLDAFNSMLSLGYTLLMYEIYGEVENKGLNPYVGFMHKDRERHPTLCSDLMEEWRAVIVDSTVLSLVMGNEIDIEDFQVNVDEPGVFLNRKAMNIFIKKYDAKLRNVNGYLKNDEGKISYRKSLWFQTNQLTRAIEANDLDLYRPVVIR